MGHIMSAVEKIDRTNFTAPKSGRIAKATRVFRHDNNHVIVELSPGNYMPCRLYGYHKNAAWIPGPNHHRMIDGLHKLGHISKEEVAEHKRRVDKHHKEDNKQYDRERLEEMAKLHGFTITPEQRSKLRAKKQKPL